MNVAQFFIICKRTDNANNATHHMKLCKKGRESSKRKYYIISPRVIIIAIIIIMGYAQSTCGVCLACASPVIVVLQWAHLLSVADGARNIGIFIFFWFWIRTANAPITAGTHTGWGAVIMKPRSAWLEGTPAMDLGHIHMEKMGLKGGVSSLGVEGRN